MWQSLLPGFRHLRAPLTAGYIWLLALWLLLRQTVTSNNRMTEIRDGISEIANWAGRPASIAATALAVYLIIEAPPGTLRRRSTIPKAPDRAFGLL